MYHNGLFLQRRKVELFLLKHLKAIQAVLQISVRIFTNIFVNSSIDKFSLKRTFYTTNENNVQVNQFFFLANTYIK